MGRTETNLKTIRSWHSPVLLQVGGLAFFLFSSYYFAHILCLEISKKTYL